MCSLVPSVGPTFVTVTTLPASSLKQFNFLLFFVCFWGLYVACEKYLTENDKLWGRTTPSKKDISNPHLCIVCLITFMDVYNAHGF